LYETVFVSTSTGPSIWCQSAWLISHQKQRHTACIRPRSIAGIVGRGSRTDKHIAAYGFASLDNLPPQPNGTRVHIYKKASSSLYLPNNAGPRSFQPPSMVTDAAHDPMLALLEKLNPPWHRTTYSHWYIDLSRSVAIAIDHYIFLTTSLATHYGVTRVPHTKELI